MRIQHNINALNSHRNLSFNTTNTGKNLEKLSSGYRINRAGDDAAGLAISEKMRGQINGLAQAQNNAQDGISLIQTAEGGLNETHAILQKMRTLAVQSANGTYQNEVDRENINKEVEALKTEIDRISSSTHYNKINLLDGSLGGTTSTEGVQATLELSNMAKANGAYGLNDATYGQYTSTALSDITGLKDGDTFSYTVNYKDENGNDGSYTMNFTADVSNNKLVAEDGTKFDMATAGTATSVELSKAVRDIFEKSDLAQHFEIADKDTADGTLSFYAKEGGNDTYRIASISTYTVKDGVRADSTLSVTATATNKAVKTESDATAAAVAASTGPEDAFETIDISKIKAYDGTDATKDIFTINGQKFAFATSADNAKTLGSDVNVIVTAAGADPATADRQGMMDLINQKTGLSVKGNATTDTMIELKGTPGSVSSNNKGLEFQIGANGVKDQRVTLKVADMSSKGIGVDSINVSTQDDANSAIAAIDSAINTVSGTRADLGALQNRLEHTVNNLAVTEENLTASESRIRDVDMAKEMMSYTKNNILTQAAQAMLAQANQQPQGVLQLLQ